MPGKRAPKRKAGELAAATSWDLVAMADHQSAPTASIADASAGRRALHSNGGNSDGAAGADLEIAGDDAGEVDDEEGDARSPDTDDSEEAMRVADEMLYQAEAACADMDDQSDATDVPGQEPDDEGAVELATEVLDAIAPVSDSVADPLEAPAAEREGANPDAEASSLPPPPPAPQMLLVGNPGDVAILDDMTCRAASAWGRTLGT